MATYNVAMAVTAVCSPYRLGALPRSALSRWLPTFTIPGLRQPTFRVSYRPVKFVLQIK